MRAFDIDDLVRASVKFSRRLADVKKRCKDAVSPGWYPYQSFPTIRVLAKLLTGENRKLSRLIGKFPVLDMGAGDGDLSFFFESLGLTVDAIDHPAINYNRMMGIHALKNALGSSVDIQTFDLDTQFALRRPVYGLVFLFGVLYHLRNPFYVLEALARQSEYCLMSTRIARMAPDQTMRLEPMPVAYLVAERETNNDPTNYWIFTEAGLRRLVARAGWEIIDFMTTGDTSASDPVHKEHDERAFCLLRSRVTDYTRHAELGDGWYHLENGMWRWTQKRFTMGVSRPPGDGATDISLAFYIPEVIVQSLGKVILGASVNGIALQKHVYTTPGEQLYSAKIPPDAMHEGRLRIDFAVEETFSFGVDERELGVLVNFMGRSPVSLL
jgi:tRNA (mo5U34)-methyltransferase